MALRRGEVCPGKNDNKGYLQSIGNVVKSSCHIVYIYIYILYTPQKIKSWKLKLSIHEGLVQMIFLFIVMFNEMCLL